MNKSRVVLIALIGLGALLFAFPTSSAPETKSSAKNITFNKDIAPIFFKSCAECHRPGESAPFSVLSYKDVRPWAKSIREKVVNRAIVVTREGDRYFSQTPTGLKPEIFPVTETKFSIPDFEEQFTFVKDEKGEVVELLVEQNGRVVRCKRIKESATGSGQQ